MKMLARLVCSTLIGSCVAFAPAGFAADGPKKNWTAPTDKIYGQKLVDEQMAKHKDLLSATLHGTPPGMTDVYTMFAGSFPERIGNPDDPDDIDVSKKGITILDPRWKRVNDKDKKFVVLMPMRDKAGENVGLVVYAFKNPAKPAGLEQHYLKIAEHYRDELAKKISSYDRLYEAAK